MSYINRKNTEDAIRKYADTKHCNGEQIEFVNGILKSISVIKEQPSADVVEVCRCEKCKYSKIHTCAITGIETLFCDYGEKPVAVEPSHYCSYGERKEKNDFKEN